MSKHRPAGRPSRRPGPPFEAERRAVRKAIIEFNRWYDVGAMVVKPYPDDDVKLPDDYALAYGALKDALKALWEVLPWQGMPPGEGDLGIHFTVDLVVTFGGVQYALVYDAFGRGAHYLLLGGWPVAVTL